MLAVLPTINQGRQGALKTAMRPTRPISWLAPAWKDFNAFPEGARETIADALRVAAEGGKADIANPMKVSGRGV
jgi:phage-related protein